MQREELSRQAKVVDMMLTMHSILASRYRLRAQILELTLVAASIFLAALALADPAVLSYFNVRPQTARILIGLCTILVFFLSIVSLIVDWKGKASQHQKAFDTLIPLKSEWSHMLTAYEEHDDDERAAFAQRSALTIGSLIPIPDSQFNRLKARHYRKVMLSKLVSAHPGSSVSVLRLCLWWRSNRKAWEIQPGDHQ